MHSYTIPQQIWGLTEFDCNLLNEVLRRYPQLGRLVQTEFGWDHITDADSVHATFEGGVVYITGGDQIKVKVVTYSAVPLNKIDVTFTLGELRSANE